MENLYTRQQLAYKVKYLNDNVSHCEWVVFDFDETFVHFAAVVVVVAAGNVAVGGDGVAVVVDGDGGGAEIGTDATVAGAG